MASPPASTSLVRKSTDTSLMPPPPTKRIKRPSTVLDEDTYTTALSDIIARDFFPGLLETQHQQEYLDSLASGDAAWIADASRRLTEVMNTPQHRRRGTSFKTPIYRPDVTPAVSNPMATPSFETPVPASSVDTKKDTPVDTTLSLSNFQAKYTSEDNESFNALLDKQNAKRRSAYSFLWNNNHIPGARQQAAHARLLENPEQKDRKLIEDTRPSVPNTWKEKPKNGLMFTPDSPPQKPVKEADKGGVAYANTRMPAPREEREGSPTPSFIDAAIAGFPRAETPRVNGYSFVTEKTPASALLGKPEKAGGSMPFRIAATPKREEVLHRMVDKVARGKRVGGGKEEEEKVNVRRTNLGGGGKGREVPRFKTGPVMTPAGERLLMGLRKGTEERRGRGEAWTPRMGTPRFNTPSVKRR